MRKARIAVLIWFLLGCSLLAAINFIPLLKNAAGQGRDYEWAAACLIGAAAIAAALLVNHDYSVPSFSAEGWHKHHPVKERLVNVPITDMLRAERQYVLYNSPANLVVLLTLLMWDNRQCENIICQSLNLLIEYHRPLIFIQRQQIKQRETIVKHALSSIQNGVKFQHTINNMQFSNLATDNLNHHSDEQCQRTLEIVRAIISLHLEGHRHEDIVDALNAGTIMRRSKNAKPPIKAVNNNMFERFYIRLRRK
jgi:hypothetical protein